MLHEKPNHLGRIPSRTPPISGRRIGARLSVQGLGPYRQVLKSGTRNTVSQRWKNCLFNSGTGTLVRTTLPAVARPCSEHCSWHEGYRPCLACRSAAIVRGSADSGELARAGANSCEHRRHPQDTFSVACENIGSAIARVESAALLFTGRYGLHRQHPAATELEDEVFER